MITLLEDQAKMCHTLSGGSTSLHNECKICVAQNFGGLLCKNILTEKIGWLVALHSKSARVKILVNKTICKLVVNHQVFTLKVL